MKKNNMLIQILKAREQGYQDGIKFTVENYSSVLLLCLKDKFNFTTEQLQEIAGYVNDAFESVCEGYLTLNDITETLKKENDIDITFKKGDKIKSI